MSQEHPHSTPGRFFPKPVITAFNSAGILQKKSKGITERNSLLSNTPETPSKLERSKFIVPLNLTPFALSPKILLSKSSNTATNKPTLLKQESAFDNSSDLPSSFDDSILNTSCNFNSSMLNEVYDQEMAEESFDQSFNYFLDAPAENDVDFDMGSTTCSPGRNDDESVEYAAYSAYTEPWKSVKMNFLNQWAEDCIDFNSYYEIPENKDFFAEAFEIIEVVGHGSFSVVYKVRSKINQAIYAVKKTKFPFKGNADRNARIREVENLWKVRSCPHCIRIEMAWEQYGHLYILTEFCGSGSLKTLIDHLAEVDERFTERSIWEILLQCCLALQYMHGNNILHLDLKPENIFICDHNQLKIGDFGLSTIVGSAPSLSSEGDKYYMAPEVLEGIYTKAADIFSLGLIILELAADVELPSNGDSWQNLRHGDFSELSLDDTSDMLNQLIIEMTNPCPELRPSIEKVLWRTQFYLQKSAIKSS